MNLLLPIILIASSLAVFFGYVDPNYNGSGTPSDYKDPKASISYLKGELSKYDSVLTSSTQVDQKIKDLIDKRTTLTGTDRLEKLLPSNIDNIRLIIEISKIAERNGLVAKSISVGDMMKATPDTIGADNSPYGTLALKFTVSSSYPTFLNFLKDLENNLRLLDVTDISFNSTDTGIYDFSVSLNTYWLK